MRTKLLIWIIAFILLVQTVFSAGVCSLDSFDYSPGEQATFTCACSLPTEENQVGDIVWRNSSGFILQNNSGVSSGLCRTSLFGDSWVVPRGAGYEGNATFETTAVSWVGDIVSDNFNVSGAHTTNCLITNITGSSSIRLGDVGAVKFKVLDETTFNPLIHVSCVADGYDVSGAPLLFEPTLSGDGGFRKTSSGGEVGFIHQMDEKFWKKDTTYLFEFHCFSLPNSSDGEHVAYDEETGGAVGLKSCTAEQLFTTNGNDLRTGNPNNFFGVGIILVGLMIFSYLMARLFGESEKDLVRAIKLIFFTIGFSTMLITIRIVGLIMETSGASTDFITLTNALWRVAVPLTLGVLGFMYLSFFKDLFKYLWSLKDDFEGKKQEKKEW